MSDEMSEQTRRPRADAERNRRRLLDAAAAVFGERGLDVGVAEIAQRAGVGRGTLFRNFPTKEDLIAAIVVDQMNDAAARGRELLEAPDAGEALVRVPRGDGGAPAAGRGLFEAVQDDFLANREIREAHAAIVGCSMPCSRAPRMAGAVRPDVRALDVLLLIKGVCETAAAFQQLDPRISERHLDLVRAALAPPATAHMLRGRSATLDDLERALAGAEIAWRGRHPARSAEPSGRSPPPACRTRAPEPQADPTRPGLRRRPPATPDAGAALTKAPTATGQTIGSNRPRRRRRAACAGA